MSGLTVNFLKDNFFGFMWMRGLWLTPLISCTVHCPMSCFGILVLGVSPMRVSMWEPVISSFRMRLGSQKGRYLSL